MSYKYDTFLGGACNPTTWRSDAIIELEKNNVTYYNPQKTDWCPELVEYERMAKENSTILLFVFQPTITTGVASLIEVSYLSGVKKNLVLVMPKWTEDCNLNENLNIENAYEIVRNISESSSAKVFETIEDAIDFIKSSVREVENNNDTSITKEKQVTKISSCNHVRSSISSFLNRVEEQIKLPKNHCKTKPSDDTFINDFKRRLKISNTPSHSLDFQSKTLIFQTKGDIVNSFHLTHEVPSVNSINLELKRLNINHETYEQNRSKIILSFLFKSKELFLMNPYRPGISIKRSNSYSNHEENLNTCLKSCIKKSFSFRTPDAQKEFEESVLTQTQPKCSKRSSKVDLNVKNNKKRKCVVEVENLVLNYDLIIAGISEDLPGVYVKKLKDHNITHLTIKDPSDHNQFFGCLLTIFIIDGKSVQISNLVHASYLIGLKFPVMLVISSDLTYKNLEKVTSTKRVFVKSQSENDSFKEVAHSKLSLDSGYSGSPIPQKKEVTPEQSFSTNNRYDTNTMKDFLRGITYVKDLSKETNTPVLEDIMTALDMAIEWLILAKQSILVIPNSTL